MVRGYRPFEWINKGRRPITHPNKKELIRSIIDRIIVDYDNTNKTHGLEVNFRIPMGVYNEKINLGPKTLRGDYSTVTLLAKFLG